MGTRGLRMASAAGQAGAWIAANPTKALFATIGATGLATVAAPAVMVAPVLGLLGFGSGGVVGGSIAAGIQAGIGNVVGGSLFALAQSAAAGGVAGLAAAQTVGGVSVVVGAVAVGAAVFVGKREDGERMKRRGGRLRRCREIRRREKMTRRVVRISKVAWRHTRTVMRKEG